MTRNKPSLPDLTDAEEAAIQAGIARDPDNPELTDEQLASMRPARSALPRDLYEALAKRGRGRPRLDPSAKKAPVKLRVDPDALDAFKAGGPGWQTRINEALKQAAIIGHCIFCDNELTPNTKAEHILLNALGGRKTTRRVICSDCNERFGQTIDKSL